jgi:hypothetical protein
MDGIFSRALKFLNLIRAVDFYLYFTLVRPKLKYAFVAWNILTPTDARKLK